MNKPKDIALLLAVLLISFNFSSSVCKAETITGANMNFSTECSSTSVSPGEPEYESVDPSDYEQKSKSPDLSEYESGSEKPAVHESESTDLSGNMSESTDESVNENESTDPTGNMPGSTDPSGNEAESSDLSGNESESPTALETETTVPDSTEVETDDVSNPKGPDSSQTHSFTYSMRYRMYNGRPQYRIWNETQGCWKDPCWKDAPTPGVKKVNLRTGGTVKLRISTVNPYFSGRVYWKSRKPGVVQAYKNGRLKAKRHGIARVDAINKKNQKIIGKVKVVVRGR